MTKAAKKASKAPRSRIVSGVGAAASGRDRERTSRIEKAMSDAITKALADGITDADEQRALMLKAREEALRS
jgi:hypothetical protein